MYLTICYLQVVHAVIVVHSPHLQCHVITARREELSLRVPFNGINLICVTLERLDGPVLAELAHVDLLVSGARGEALL